MKSLHIKYRLNFHLNDVIHRCSNIHLKELFIGDFQGKFEDLILLFKGTRNLRNLTISVANNLDILNASQWEQLITGFLPYLKNFQFQFTCSLITNRWNIIFDKFQQFQSDFWQKEHHWCTEYIKQYDSASIYTKPYPCDHFYFHYKDSKFCSNSMAYTNVTNLHYSIGKCFENDQFYFPNIRSLIFNRFQPTSRLTIRQIQSIKRILNLSTVKHLSIRQIDPVECSSLIELFQNLSQLSSLTIDSFSLRLCLKNNQLCQYFTEKIENFDQNGFDLLWYDIHIDQFCQIFSNIKHIQCNIDREMDLIILLKHLPKLSTMKITCASEDHQDPKMKSILFEQEIRPFNLVYK